MTTPIIASFWLTILLAAVSGALIPLSLAPYGYWPLGIIGASALAILLQLRSTTHTYWIAFAFGLGLYGVGASWVYISINQFGSTSVALSLILTCAFVSGLSLAFALPFYAFGRWLNRSRLGLLFGFTAIWVLGEWMRSWFLTGFPWLYVGYAHIHTPLAGWAPVIGIFGVSAVAVLTSGLMAYCVIYYRSLNRRVFYGFAGSVFALWVTGALIKNVQWTQLEKTPITLGMAQGNIPQEKKWDPEFLPETMRIFHGLSKTLWQYDWVIWPEAAIPLLYHQALPYVKQIEKKSNATNTAFITGILYDQPNGYKFYNSIIGLGLADGITYKTRLVPFGEYVPLEEYLRGTIEFFNLPTSIIHPGPAYTNGLQTPQGEIAPSICYEVVYPDLVAKRALTAKVLLTISNDAWFGHSIGPIQHFEMAQMRALETGRYMIRATNNGLSGIIDPKGKTLVQGGRFTREAITGTVHAASGATPFMILSSWPVILVLFVGLLVTARRQRQHE